LFEMDRRHSLDIDEEIDLKIAELFLSECPGSSVSPA
jgi:CMP-N-acetylneuraminic acid synthetase